MERIKTLVFFHKQYADALGGMDRERFNLSDLFRPCPYGDAAKWQRWEACGDRFISWQRWADQCSRKIYELELELSALVGVAA